MARLSTPLAMVTSGSYCPLLVNCGRRRGQSLNASVPSSSEASPGSRPLEEGRPVYDPRESTS